LGKETVRYDPTNNTQEKDLKSKISHGGLAQTFGLFKGTNEVWNQASLQGVKPNESSYLPGRKLVVDKKAKISIRVKNI